MEDHKKDPPILYRLFRILNRECRLPVLQEKDHDFPYPSQNDYEFGKADIYDNDPQILLILMPIASSQYWNSIHGRVQGEAEMDEEGKQTMRALARNMTFLMKSIALGKKEYGLPEKEQRVSTNFID